MLNYTHIIRLIRRKAKVCSSLAISATLTTDDSDTCTYFSGYSQFPLTTTTTTNTTMATSKYLAAPHSIQPLPQAMHSGLIGVGICGLASFLSTLSLFAFLVYRIFTWRAHYKSFLGYNQYIVLFVNLIFADLCQAASFLISFYWIAIDGILAPTAACTTQGFLLHFGDVASAFFVLAIALHTYITAARGIRVEYWAFTAAIGMIWLFALFLTVLGFGMHKEKYFVRAGTWCWVSDDYEPERLGLHYVWLFLSEFGLIVTYMITFVKLRRKTNSLFANQRRASYDLANKTTIEAVNRITKLMMLYPFVYVLLTLPLSSARMWSMAHESHNLSTTTQCIVGALLASCGWVDCLLYSFTRKRLMRETMGGGIGGLSSDSCGLRMPLNDIDPKSLNSILATTTFTIRNSSFDASRGRQMPAPTVISEISAGTGEQQRARSERDLEDGYERSPSWQRFAESGFAPRDIGVAPVRDNANKLPAGKKLRRVQKSPRLRPLPRSRGSMDLTSLTRSSEGKNANPDSG